MNIAQLYTHDVILLYYFQSIVILILLVMSFVINSFFKIVSTPSLKTIVLIYMLSITASFLGTTLGLFIGLSHSPVVGVFIPALLTFISGVSVYLFVQKDTNLSSQNRLFAALNIALISFFLMIGSIKGSDLRMAVEDENKYQNFQYKLYEKEFDYKWNQKEDDTSEIEIISFEDLKKELKKKGNEN